LAGFWPLYRNLFKTDFRYLVSLSAMLGARKHVSCFRSSILRLLTLLVVMVVARNLHKQYLLMTSPFKHSWIISWSEFKSNLPAQKIWYVLTIFRLAVSGTNWTAWKFYNTRLCDRMEEASRPQFWPWCIYSGSAFFFHS
jgi:hypothetical protein